VAPRSRAPTEHEWIRRLTRRLHAATKRVVIGPGDDAAALHIGRTTLLVTTDALVDGVHFRSHWLSPRALGARAYAVNASDVAAMGGEPLYALLALQVPRGVRTATLDAVIAGFVAAARPHGAILVGGNVTAGPVLALTVTVLGVAGTRVVTRAGARPGDCVVVSGRLGVMGAAVRDRRGGRATPLPRVPDRVPAGRLLARYATAMIDVSDGLVQDLGHVARASKVAIRVDAPTVPIAARLRNDGRRGLVLALTAGEDYELACTVPPSRLVRLARRAEALGISLTPIGVVERGRSGVRVVLADGTPLALDRGGFDHLAGTGRRR
jgi:thiamine-monophosphate kinase